MGASGGPSIVHDNLVLGLEAADKNSYIGSGTTWSDLSPNGNDGTLSAAAIGTVSSSLKTMAFNGSSTYVDCGTGASITDSGLGHSESSIFLWINASNYGDEAAIISSGTDETNGSLIAGRSSTTIRVDQNYGDKYYIEDSDAAVTANTWQYIGYTMVSSSGVGPILTAYSNGTNRLMGSVGTDVSGVAEAGATGNFIIGRRSWAAESYIKGSISTVQVYNRALSLNEIQQNFNAQRTRFGV